METYRFDEPRSAIDVLKTCPFEETFHMYNFKTKKVYMIDGCLVIADSLLSICKEVDVRTALDEGYKVCRYIRATDKLETLEIEIKPNI